MNRGDGFVKLVKDHFASGKTLKEFPLTHLQDETFLKRIVGPILEKWTLNASLRLVLLSLVNEQVVTALEKATDEKKTKQINALAENISSDLDNLPGIGAVSALLGTISLSTARVMLHNIVCKRGMSNNGPTDFWFMW